MMEPRSIDYVRAAVDGELLTGSPDALCLRVTTDSRDVRTGDLFVAVQGERFDGHDFLADAARKGAVGALIHHPPTGDIPPGFALIRVGETRVALGALARRYREEFSFPLVCVAGSNGKTTTKELAAALLSTRWFTAKSEASFNNDIGVPLTLLRFTKRHQAAVVEAGTNHPGELEPLLDSIRPTIGAIPSIGREHLEFFKDMEGVLAEEGKLGEVLPADGLLVLNGDIPWAERLAALTRARVIRAGFAPNNEWRVRIVATHWESTAFEVTAPDAAWTGSYLLGMPGRHMVQNAVIALTVAAQLGVDPDAARNALARFSGARQRLQWSRIGGVWLIDDTYNANADSMLAALETLSDLPCSGRRVAVLGDMAELGPQAETAHGEVGRNAAALGLDAVFAIGKYSRITADAASSPSVTSVSFPDIDSAMPAVLEYLRPGDAVLAKASRSSRLERIVEALQRNFNHVPAE